MSKLIAVIGAGAMGSGVGRRLVENGLRVTTPLEGRSAATVKRAQDAGMTPIGFDQIADAEMVLSIIPPGDAGAVATRAAGLFASTGKAPIYVDCNAISPQTSAGIEALLAPVGAAYVDAGIIGAPPTPGSPGPLFYASGPAAEKLAALAGFGLRVSVLDQPNGAASSLKMSYAGMTKGFTALTAMMMLAAARSGADKALMAELAQSQPALLPWVTRAIPLMCPKAYRWVAEMEEIGAFAADDPAAQGAFQAIASFYQHIADDMAGSGVDATQLKAMVAPKP